MRKALLYEVEFRQLTDLENIMQMLNHNACQRTFTVNKSYESNEYGKISKNRFSELFGKYAQQTKRKALYINVFGNFSLGLENSQNRNPILERKPINARNVESPSSRSLPS